MYYKYVCIIKLAKFVWSFKNFKINLRQVISLFVSRELTITVSKLRFLEHIQTTFDTIKNRVKIMIDLNFLGVF